MIACGTKGVLQLNTAGEDDQLLQTFRCIESRQMDMI
jgi:hypothetical protein